MELRPETLPLDLIEQLGLIDDEAEIERRRTEGVLVKGAIGWMRFKDTFTIEEVKERHAQGLGTPYDLMPFDYWSPPELPFPRFGEEMLGKDF